MKWTGKEETERRILDDRTESVKDWRGRAMEKSVGDLCGRRAVKMLNCGSEFRMDLVWKEVKVWLEGKRIIA